MYYLHYEEETSVNYCFLFSLYLLAERNTKERINNIIKYESLSKLSKRIETECNYKISSSTISRILNNSNYNLYLTHNKKDKTIMLNNNFKRTNKTANNKFVVLNDYEIKFLIAEDNILLNKYYLYLKYYCGYSKSKESNFTAKQFLTAIGYCANSGKLLAEISRINFLLSDNGFISI